MPWVWMVIKLLLTHRLMLWDDPEGVTFGAVEALVVELAGLFPDPVLGIGTDETVVSGNCTAESFRSFEQACTFTACDV